MQRRRNSEVATHGEHTPYNPKGGGGLDEAGVPKKYGVSF